MKREIIHVVSFPFSTTQQSIESRKNSISVSTFRELDEFIRENLPFLPLSFHVFLYWRVNIEQINPLKSNNKFLDYRFFISAWFHVSLSPLRRNRIVHGYHPSTRDQFLFSICHCTRVQSPWCWFFLDTVQNCNFFGQLQLFPLTSKVNQKFQTTPYKVFLRKISNAAAEIHYSD